MSGARTVIQIVRASWVEKLMPHNYPAYAHVLQISARSLGSRVQG
jgi:hypothetical protein